MNDQIEFLQALKYLKLNECSNIQECYNLILKGEDLYEVIGNCKKLKKNFESHCFEKYKMDELTYLDLLENPEVHEGMFECKKCKSKKVLTNSKQTRSGDEATTVFAKCTKCNYKWIVN